MLVQTERTLALRCPACGRQHAQGFSLFGFTRVSSRTLHCDCGSEIARIERRGRVVRTAFTCLICDGLHECYFSTHRFLTATMIPIVCTQTGTELGCIGEPDAVQQALAGEDVLENLVFDPECVDYFENPRVMHDTLASIQAMAEVGRLGCACGNNRVELDIYPEKVELICPDCDSTVVLNAQTEEDRRLALELRALTLPAVTPMRESSRTGSRRNKG